MTDQQGSGDGGAASDRGSLSDIGAERARLATDASASPADRRAPVARWVVSLSEPLMSTLRRADVDADMASFIDRNPRWACRWAAGVLHDVSRTLPPDDPWLRLSGTIDLARISVGEPGAVEETWLEHRHPEGAPPPGETGAVLPDGQRFGSVGDSGDILLPDLGAPESDIGLVGLAEPLPDLAAGVAGFVSAPPAELVRTLTAVHQHLWLAGLTGKSEESAGVAFLGVLSPVIRRFVHRRRVYTGQDDPFPSVAGFAWMARADRLMSEDRTIDQELGLASEAAIDPAAYRDLMV